MAAWQTTRGGGRDKHSHPTGHREGHAPTALRADSYEFLCPCFGNLKSDSLRILLLKNEYIRTSFSEESSSYVMKLI